jgi:hypothetical protein
VQKAQAAMDKIPKALERIFKEIEQQTEKLQPAREKLDAALTGLPRTTFVSYFCRTKTTFEKRSGGLRTFWKRTASA